MKPFETYDRFFFIKNATHNPPLMDLLKFRINVMSQLFLSNYMCCIRDASFTVNTLFISWGGDIERIYHSPV